MSLRVASWNAGGLRRRRQDNDFIHLSKDFDVIAVQETFIHRTTRQVTFPGFLLFKKDATTPV
jgi:exonuclease III